MLITVIYGYNNYNEPSNKPAYKLVIVCLRKRNCHFYCQNSNVVIVCCYKLLRYKLLL